MVPALPFSALTHPECMSHPASTGSQGLRSLEGRALSVRLGYASLSSRPHGKKAPESLIYVLPC